MCNKKAYKKNYYIKHKEKYKIRNKAYRTKHKEEIKAYKKAYCIENKEKIQIYSKIHHIENKEKHNIYAKTYHVDHKEEIEVCNKAYRNKHRIKCNALTKAYHNKHKEKYKTYMKIYMRQKRRTDLRFKLNHNISTAINHSLKGNKAGRGWEALVNYTLNDLKKHFEKLFIKDMTWDKFLKGEIHIDHKIPISVFNFTKPEHKDFKKCWALSNLQPLWAEDNLKKSAKIDKHFQPSLLL